MPCEVSFFKEPRVGLEPTTFSLRMRCSNRLSYCGLLFHNFSLKLCILPGGAEKSPQSYYLFPTLKNLFPSESLFAEGKVNFSVIKIKDCHHRLCDVGCDSADLSGCAAITVAIVIAIIAIGRAGSIE